MDAEWHGMAELMQAYDRVVKQADEASKEIVVKGALMVETEAKNNFQGSHARGEPHVGGDKPNVVTGALRASIISDAPKQITKGVYSIVVGPRKLYGRRVELGYNGSRKYPYFTPAVKEVKPRIQDLADRVWASFLAK